MMLRYTSVSILLFFTMLPVLFLLVSGIYLAREEKKKNKLKDYIAALWFIRIVVLFILLHISFIIFWFV